MAKKRDHKKVLVRRRKRQSKQDKSAQEDFKKVVLKEYADGGVLPMPTLNDALACQDIAKDKDVLDAITKMIHHFSDDIEQLAKKRNDLKIYLPDNVVSFVIPLDFYIPLASPYDAITLKATKGEMDLATCVTVVSKIMQVGDSAVKVSYLITTICSNNASLASKNETPAELLKIYETAISVSNNLISSFQAIPSRHNHYFHQITAQSAPAQIKSFSFNRKTRKILKKLTLNIHGNVFGEMLQCRQPNESELAFFRNLHINKSFSDDKIFRLISKINEAVNLRCFGRNNESIVMADNFVELSLGYLYCEVRLAGGEDCTVVYDDYSKIKDMAKIWDTLVELLGYTSKTKLKKDIGFNEWKRDCRNKRDNLTHRFLTGDYTGRESLDALYFSCELIRKLCIIIRNKINSNEYPILDKMELLISATIFVKGMRERDELERKGVKEPQPLNFMI